MQIGIGALILYFPAGRAALLSISEAVQKVIDYGNDGIGFLFGGLVSDKMFEVFGGGGFIFAAVIVIAVIGYMAFITTTVTVKADSDGVVRKVMVEAGAVVQKDMPLYTLAIVEKKWKDNKVEESTKEKVIKAKTNGKVLQVFAKDEDKVKKGKTPILELEHEKGTLP